MSCFRYAEMALGNWYVNKRWSAHVAPFAAAAAAWRTTTMHWMNHKFFRNENGVIIDANCSMRREIWLWKIVRMGPECTCSSICSTHQRKKKKSPIIRDIHKNIKHKHLLHLDFEHFFNWLLARVSQTWIVNYLRTTKRPIKTSKAEFEIVLYSETWYILCTWNCYENFDLTHPFKFADVFYERAHLWMTPWCVPAKGESI